MGDALNLATQIREAEILKSDIVCTAGKLYKVMAAGTDIREITDLLGEMVLHVYFLGDKLGISPMELEESILAKLKASDVMDEKVHQFFLAGLKNGKGY